MQQRFRGQNLCVSLLAVAGAAIIRWKGVTADFWIGFLLMQLANASFAFGMVLCKRLVETYPNTLKLSQCFSWFFLGALALIAPAYFWLGDSSKLPSQPIHFAALAFLGIFATALGQFLWNKGCTQVSIGTTAVMNNAVVPLGLILNRCFFDHPLPLIPFLLGSSLMILALWVNHRVLRTSHLRRFTRENETRNKTS